MNVFTWVNNFDKPIQRMCVESLLRYNPTAKVFTYETIRELPGGSEFIDKFKHVSSVHFSDLFRVWYLLNFGGTWIDADCIHMRPMEFPYQLDSSGVAMCYEDHRRDKNMNTFIHCPNPGNKFLGALFDRQCKLVEHKGPRGLEYLDLGSWAIDHIRANSNLSVMFVPHWEYSYIAWYSGSRFIEQRHWSNFQHDRGIYSPNSYCYHLTNGVIAYAINDTREHLLSLSTYMSFLLKRALTNGFDGTRHKAILDRLPNHLHEYQYAEVGVYQGHTASIVGQQRNNATIHCIDPWKNISTQEYLQTGDYLAHASNEDHEVNYQDYRNNCWFISSQGRLREYRMDSVCASRQFENESMDLVFLDGDHSFSGVSRDIEAWWPKVKRGAFLGGHDYNYDRLAFGVNEAVDNFAGRLGLSLELDGDYTWFIRKPS